MRWSNDNPRNTHSQRNGKLSVGISLAVLVVVLALPAITQTTAPPAPAAQSKSPAAAPQQPAPQPPAATPETPAAAAPAASTPLPSQPVAPAPRPRISIVLDAAHGGDERGAALTDKLNEKDITLALARRIRAELVRAGLSVALVRDADITLDPDHRAEIANASHPQIYVALHVSNLGSGLRIYTAVMPQLNPAPGTLTQWARAQQSWLDASHAAAESLAADLGDRDISANTLAAPLAPLNHITAAAVAIEVAPPPGGRASIDLLASPQFQQRIAAALAVALNNARSKVEAPE